MKGFNKGLSILPANRPLGIPFVVKSLADLFSPLV
jgi:hypothetical protein